MCINPPSEPPLRHSSVALARPRCHHRGVQNFRIFPNWPLSLPHARSPPLCSPDSLPPRVHSSRDLPTWHHPGSSPPSARGPPGSSASPRGGRAAFRPRRVTGNVHRVRGPLPPALPRVPGQSAGASHLPVIVTRAAAKVEVQTSAGVPGLTSGCKELLGHVFRVGTLRAAFLSGRPMSRSHARLRLHPGNSEIVIFIIIQTFF